MTALSSLATEVSAVLCLFVKACSTLLLFSRTFLMLSTSLATLLSALVAALVVVASSLVARAVLAPVKLASIARSRLRSCRSSALIGRLFPPTSLTEHVGKAELAHAVAIRYLTFSLAHIGRCLEDVICSAVGPWQEL